MSESDGMSELFEDAVRQAVMVGARLGEQLARHRQARLAETRRVSEQAGRELVARFDAERLSARAALQGVDSRDWWKSATPEQIGAAFVTATAWRDDDAEIAALHARISDRLERRGIDPTAASEKVAALRRAEEAAEFDSSALFPGGELPQDAPRDGSAPPAEEARAEIATAADRAGNAYDSAERRAKLAIRLEGKGTEQEVNARLLADLSQGTPATAAVQQQRKTAVTRSTKTPAGPSRQQVRGGR